MTEGFIDLAVVVGLATVLGIIARMLKQPIILAYIFTGIAVGIFSFFHITNGDLFKTFADLGIMFLLFLIGLEINYSSLRLVGKTALILGLLQIAITSTIGFFISRGLNFPIIDSLYIGIALTFASTVIVVKMLSDKKESNSLYGKISLGLLLVQDLVAVIILVFLSSAKAGTFQASDVILAVLKAAALFIGMMWLGRKTIPLLLDKIAKSPELLFLTSLSWCFLIAAFITKAGFSIEIGGFLAGIALANSSEHFEIAGKIKSLRDFFILIFFVVLGSSFVFSNFSGLTLPIIVFSLFVLFGNPIIVMMLLGIMGYKKRTSFLCGITVAQISEFSFILMALGVKLGHISQKSASIVIAAGIISILSSAYLMTYSEKVFQKLSRLLSIFERKTKREKTGELSGQKPIILIGAHRIGQNIASYLPKDKLLIIDYDPDVIRELNKKDYSTLFGDIADEEIIEKAGFEKAQLVICTSSEFEDNLRLLTVLKKNGRGVKIILRAENEEDAKMFYGRGADYVVLPHFTSGQYLGRMISVDPALKIIDQLKQKDLEMIKKSW